MSSDDFLLHTISGSRLLLNSMILFCLLYSEISLLVAQSFGILQISINGSATVPIIQLDSSAFYIGLDYDYGYDNNACMNLKYLIQLSCQLKHGSYTFVQE